MFMIYNKLIDKVSCHPDMVDHITALDELILTYFLKPSSEDLQQLSEHIMKKEFEFINKELDGPILSKSEP